MTLTLSYEIIEFSDLAVRVNRQHCPELVGNLPHLRLHEAYERGRFRRKAGGVFCRAHEVVAPRGLPMGGDVCSDCVQALQRELKYLRLNKRESTRSAINQE